MSANAPIQITPLTQDIECPSLSVADIFGLIDNRLTGEALEEVNEHISSCNPCQALATEIRLIYKTQAQPLTRLEQLTYLKNVLSPLQTLLDEPAYKFDKKFRAKTNKRLSGIEKVVKQNQVTVNTPAPTNTDNPLILHKFESSVFHNLFAELEGIEGLEYPLQANPALECGQFDVHHFAMLFRAELTKDEGLELIEHLPECLACSTIYKEVYKTFEYVNRKTRAEELNALRCHFGGLATIASELRRKVIKRLLSKSERKLKRHFQDELSINVQGLIAAFVETYKTEILTNAVAPLQEQVKQLQAQVDLLLAEKKEVSSNAN